MDQSWKGLKLDSWRVDKNDVMKNTTIKILTGILLVAAYALVGCSNKAQSSDSSSVLPPGSGSGTVVVPTSSFMLTTDFSTATNSGNNPSVTTYLHRTKTVTTTDTDWSNACSIPQSETDVNKKYINCLLEVNELDLWFNNFSLNWGAAPNMCAYVSVHPFWFFQYQPDLTGSANGIHVSYTVTDSGPPVFDAVDGGNAGGVVQFRGDKLYCAYDYSWKTPVAGPNCCEGTYNLTVTTCNTDSTGAVKCTASLSTQSWGGQYGNCASGPATQSSWGVRDVVHNYPLGRIYEAVEGVGQALAILAPAQSPQGILGTVMWNSNYYKNATPTSLANVTTVQPQIGANYAFICYDNNREAIARIDLQVRKWNTYSELLKKQAGDPTVSGPETPFPGNKLDYWGWDDLVTGGANYPQQGL